VGESFRLISIIADAMYATDVHYMYNKADNRSTIDAGRQDPFSGAFMHDFNVVDYAPEPPDACLGISQDVLDEMAVDGENRPHQRGSMALSRRW
jgi:hypothetical protein